MRASDVTDLLDEDTVLAHEQAMMAYTPHHHMCPDCDVSLQIDAAELRCPVCMRTESADITVADATNSTKRNWTTDPSKSRRQSTLKSLEDNARLHTGDAIPHDILEEVTNIYGTIQTGAVEEEIIDGVVVVKPFVRRGNSKDQILAYLIYVTCLRRGVPRSKACVAAFMKLTAQGFSKGEQAVRKFEAQGIVKGVCMDDEPIDGFIAKYFEILHIDMQWAVFVRDLVETANRKRICMAPKPTSKIVGAI